MTTRSDTYDDYVEYGRMWKEFGDVYRKAALAAGLSESAFEILYALCDLGEGCLQRDICQYSYASKQTINSSVHKLEKDGYLRLEPAESGRGMRIYLTPAGKSLTKQRVKPFADADFSAFASFSAAERKATLSMQRAFLDKLTAAFESTAFEINGTAKEGGKQ